MRNKKSPLQRADRRKSIISSLEGVIQGGLITNEHKNIKKLHREV